MSKRQPKSPWIAALAAIGTAMTLSHCTPVAVTAPPPAHAKPAKAGSAKPGATQAKKPLLATPHSKAKEPPIPPAQSKPEVLETLYVAKKGRARFNQPPLNFETDSGTLKPQDVDHEKRQDKKQMRSLSPIIALEFQAEKMAEPAQKTTKVASIGQAPPSVRVKRSAMLEALLGSGEAPAKP